MHGKYALPIDFIKGSNRSLILQPNHRAVLLAHGAAKFLPSHPVVVVRRPTDTHPASRLREAISHLWYNPQV